MQKNTAGKWVVFAWTTADNLPKTGDAAQITANIRIDGAAANAVDDTNPTELEDGYYVFDITATEANGDSLVLCPASSTSGVQVIGVPGAVWTRPPNFAAQSIDANGRVDVIKVAGTTQTAGDIPAELAKVPKSDGTATWNATALASLQQEATDALNAYDPPTKAELDAAQASVTLANGAHGGAAATLTLGGAGGLTATHTGNTTGTVAGVTPATAADVLAQVQSALDEAFTDATSLTANGLKERLRRVLWLLQNKMTIVDATGAVTVYKDDSTTPGLSGGTVQDDSTTTTRTRSA